jgi:HK97 family phage portal protein
VYGALGAVRSSAGVNVNRETVLTYAPVWRAINLISDDVARLPCYVYRRQAPGRVKNFRHPAYPILRRKPNANMVAGIWKKLMIVHKLIQGNGYSYIVRDGGGRPLQLIPLFPDRTYPVRYNEQLQYATEISLETGKIELRKLPAEDVFHLKGLNYDGLQGYTVISKARESIGLGMAAEKYGSIFYRNNARPGIALEYPANLSEQAQRNLRESWERAHSGLDQAHRVALLREGVKLHTFSLTARDSQMLESRQFQVREVANWFGLPPHKLGDTSQVSYNSLEQSNQDYLDQGLEPHLCGFEEEAWDKLLTEEQKTRDTHEIEFNRRMLLRADLAARTNYYVQGVTTGWINPDEVREEEGSNPMPGGIGQKFRLPAGVTQIGGAPVEDEGGLDTRAAGQPVDQAIDLPDFAQEKNYDCGAAASHSIAAYFGVGPETQEEWIALLDTKPTSIQQLGTTPANIIKVLTGFGLCCTSGNGWTIEDLIRCLKAGHPVMTPIQDYGPPQEEAALKSGHWVAVVWVGGGMVVIQDPSADNVLVPNDEQQHAAGRVVLTAEQFMAIWTDIGNAGVRYDHFGIAVGETLLPEAPAEEPAAAPGQTPPAAGGGQKPAGTKGPPLPDSPSTPSANHDNMNRCGGPGSGVPGPCPEEGLKNVTKVSTGSFKTKEEAARFLSEAVSNNPTISEGGKEQRKQFMSEVVNKMPQTAVDRIGERLKEVEANRKFTDVNYSFEKETGKTLEEDDIVLGYYTSSKGKLALNGWDNNDPDDSGPGVYSHELGHVIDSGVGGGWELSTTKEFKDAFKKEIAGGQLSDYAATDIQEGFAEFCRLLWGSNLPMKDIESKFPATLKFFRKKGLA